MPAPMASSRMVESFMISSFWQIAPLNFNLRAEFDHAIAGDLVIVRGVARIARHRGKQLFAPQRHAGAELRYHGLARNEERGLHHVDRHAVLCAQFERERNVAGVLESVQYVDL